MNKLLNLDYTNLGEAGRARELLAEADRKMYAVKQLHQEHPELEPPRVEQRSRSVRVN